MKNWFKNILIPSGEKTEVVAYNSWIVRWYSGNGGYNSALTYKQPEAEIFPSEEDAQKFAEQLREAFKLVRYTGSATKVTVESQQTKLASLPKG
jgi:hypothetical protein